MLFAGSELRIWLYNRPCDMRKSYDGLSALVKGQLREDPLSGALFVFINRKGTQMKTLYFERSGYCIWSKRLEQGRYHTHPGVDEKSLLQWAELRAIIDGIDTRTVRYFKRYKHPIIAPDGV